MSFDSERISDMISVDDVNDIYQLLGEVFSCQQSDIGQRATS